MLFEVLAVLGAIGLAGAAASVRIVKQYERGLVFRFGRIRDHVRGPGLAVIAPFADRLHKVNMQIVTMAVPAQEGITRDNVTVRVDAVVSSAWWIPCWRLSTSRTIPLLSRR